MAFKIADAFVNLTADTRQAKKALRDFKTSLANNVTQFGAFARRAGAAMIGVTAAVGAGAVALAKMGAEAVESENLFEVSMGNMADAARKWSEELSRGLGINEFESRKMIGTLNVMLKSMGQSEQSAFDMAKGMSQLAYDMASFFNLKPEEAFQKIQAGITGETEPLKRLGIILNETTIKNVALTHGIIQQGEAMTESQKVQARYIALMEQTSAAQGDLARTIDSPTNKLRILQSRLEETATKLGLALIPAMNSLIDTVAPMVRALGEWVEKNKELVQTRVEKFVMEMLASVKNFAAFIKNAVIPVLASWLSKLGGKDGVVGGLEKLAKIIVVGGPLLLGIGVLISLTTSLAAAFTAITSPLGMIVGAGGLGWKLGTWINNLIERIPVLNKIMDGYYNLIVKVVDKIKEWIGLGQPSGEDLLTDAGRKSRRAGIPGAFSFGSGFADNMQSPINIKGAFQILISQLVVREEADINKIAERLYQLQQRANRAAGLA